MSATTSAPSRLLLRFFEAAGEVKTALAATKMRSAPHEHTMREFRLGPPDGIRIGEPLRAFQGVLTGEPTFQGRNEALLIPSP